MAAAYKKGGRTYQLVKMLLALPLLPAAHISPAFDFLQAKADANYATQELMQYVFDN